MMLHRYGSYMINYLIVFLIAVFISSLSQVLLKKSANRDYNNIVKQYLNFRVIVAYILFFLSNLIAIYAYKVIPLSLGGILDSTGYIYAIIFGATIFNEKINLKKIISILLIVTGIIIYFI